jgi:hypothetical protein
MDSDTAWGAVIFGYVLVSTVLVVWGNDLVDREKLWEKIYPGRKVSWQKYYMWAGAWLVGLVMLLTAWALS